MGTNEEKSFLRGAMKMKSFFERLRDTVLADLNSVLDKKERENPIALLNQYLRDSELEVKKVEKLVDRHRLLKEEFQRELKHAEFMADKRKKQAEIAQNANETTLYNMAIEEQIQYEERAAQIKLSLENTMTQLEELEYKLREMKLKLKDMHMKRLELMGRENIARANRKINQSFQNAEIGHAYSRFEEIEHYMTNLENRINHDYEKSMFDYRIAQLEKQQNQNG